MLFQAGPFWHSILQQHARNANGIQPFTNFCALEIHRENVVATTRTDHDRRASVLRWWRTKNTKRRFRDIAKSDQGLARDQSVGRFGHVAFFAKISFLAGRVVGPELNHTGRFDSDATSGHE